MLLQFNRLKAFVQTAYTDHQIDPNEPNKKMLLRILVPLEYLKKVVDKLHSFLPDNDVQN